MARVFVRHGVEGPRHDPYCWTEITFVRTDGLTVVMRMGGLGYAKLTCPDRSKRLVIRSFNCEYGDCPAAAAFMRLTGMTPWQAERVPDILEERRSRHMSSVERHLYSDMLEHDRRLRSYAE